MSEIFQDDDFDLIDKICEENISDESNKEKKVVLLVDDEVGNLEVLRIRLEKIYKILTESNPEKAVYLLDDADIDVIICDQRMPEMLGTDFLKIARNKQPNATRILLTGYSDVEDVIESINSGEVYKYILKPWDESIIKIIENAAEKAYEAKENKFLLGELQKLNSDMEADLNNIFKHSKDGIALVDLDSKTLYSSNDCLCKKLGFNTTEIINLKISDILQDNTLLKIENVLQNDLRVNEIYFSDIKIKKKNGDYYNGDISVSFCSESGTKYMMYIFKETVDDIFKDYNNNIKEQTLELPLDSDSNIDDSLNEILEVLDLFKKTEISNKQKTYLNNIKFIVDTALSNK